MDKLYNETHKTVYGYLYCLCKDKDLANDLTQETYLRAMESIGRYNGSCKFSVWLCQIGRHIWYQYLAKAVREIPSGDDVYTLADQSGMGRSAESEVFLAEDTRKVLQIIMGLPGYSGEVMILRLLYGLSFREVGFILKRSENWARVTFYRAKEKVLKTWEEMYG